jgi:hypothetical protein
MNREQGGIIWSALAIIGAVVVIMIFLLVVCIGDDNNNDEHSMSRPTSVQLW